MSEAVDNCGGQQHGHDAENGHHGEDQELGGLSMTVFGWNLLDLLPL